METAIALGDLEEVKRLLNEGAYDLTAEMTIIAAMSGDVRIMDMLRLSGSPWDGLTCAFAAKYGHLELIEYCRSYGCPWDARAVASAAQMGDLEMVRYCVRNGCPMDASACMCAAQSGNIEVLRYLRDAGCPFDYRTLQLSRDPKMLRWVRDNCIVGVHGK